MLTFKRLGKWFCAALILVFMLATVAWGGRAQPAGPAQPAALASFQQTADLAPMGLYPEDVYWDDRFMDNNGVNGSVGAIAADSNGNVYVGGDFTVAGGMPANGIARWDGSAWHALGSGVDGSVYAIAVSGSDVYVGGRFASAGGMPASRIARWDGSAWHTLGSGVSGDVYAIVVSGNNVYVGGTFVSAGGMPVSRIARWDGSAWHALGSGVNYNYASPIVSAIVVNGSDVYVGGWFTSASGMPANHIARWDGSAWHALGSGVSGGAPFPFVRAIAVNESDVYVGGNFTSAGGTPANYIVRWDGGAWHALGAGVSGEYPTIFALATRGSNVYAGGSAEFAGDVQINGIGYWNGVHWSRLGSGISGGGVSALAVANDQVFVGGGFTSAGGKVSQNFAIWHIPTAPKLHLTYTTGAPGSTFHFTAVGFPASSQAAIKINGYAFPAQTTSANGDLTFAVHTASSARPGKYVVTFSVNPQDSLTFELDSAAPVRPDVGLPPLELPGSVPPRTMLYLPLVTR